MNINDIIALAKSGYKKKDIDELLKMELPADPDPDPDPDPNPKKPDSVDPDTGNGQKDGAEGDQGQDEKGIDIEIQKQIDAAQSEIADLKAKLAKAQEKNIKKDYSSGKDEVKERNDRILDYARKLM